MRALLVIDMLNDFVEDNAPLKVKEAKKIIPFIKGKTEEFRKNKDMIVYVCDNHLENDKEFNYWPSHAVKGTKGAEVVNELKPEKDDTIIFKRRYSAFFGTDLDLTLREKNIKEIHLVGILTNICVLYTAVDGLTRDYNVIVYEKGTSSTPFEEHIWAINELKNVLKAEIR